jgi:hypothetical protein
MLAGLPAVNALDYQLYKKPPQKGSVSCVKGTRYVHEGARPMMPSHGGRERMAQGIEGKKVTFGFDIGAGVSMLDAASREKAPFGGKFNVFVYGLLPHTKTFAIGFEGGAILMFANSQKFRETLVATGRDRTPTVNQSVMGSVGDWLIPTAQISFMGNFHPLQRFNVQVKVNIGGALAIVPRYNADYVIENMLSDGSYELVRTKYRYETGMRPGISATIGTKMLYALGAHSEFGAGIDWTYIRFNYTKMQMLPLSEANTPTVTSVLSQFGFLDLHIGFAFNF